MLKTVGNPSTRYGDQTIVDGDLVIGTAGKGVHFSADPSAPGMTSEVLDDYEEGTFTATLTASTPPANPPTSTGHYTKIGRLVTVMTTFTNVDTTGASGTYFITGLPFAAANNGVINYGTVSSFQFSTETAVAAVVPNTSQIELAPTYSASLATVAAGGGKYVRATVQYIAT
jgi:hypothetical protein